ncbi:MAG: serine protease [Pseudomonadota bacterium]
MRGAFLAVLLCLGVISGARASTVIDLRAQVAQALPSVVGIMRFDPKSRVSTQLVGTGFVVVDGKHIITNAHVARLPSAQSQTKITYFAVIVAPGSAPQRLRLQLVDRDARYDLALLKLPQAADALPVLPLIATPDPMVPGAPVFSIGFPIAGALGPFPAVSSGIISAVTPSISPQMRASQLDAAMLKAPRFALYQLDMTAYPGQSGSPLLDASTGRVLGVVNATKLKSTKEKVLSDPSGISYAVMAAELRTFLLRNGLKP